MRVYEYNINNCVKGRVEAKNKRAVKRMCKRLAQIYFPLTGIKSMTIERSKTENCSFRIYY